MGALVEVASAVSTTRRVPLVILSISRARFVMPPLWITCGFFVERRWRKKRILPLAIFDTLVLV